MSLDRERADVIDHVTETSTGISKWNDPMPVEVSRLLLFKANCVNMLKLSSGRRWAISTC